MANEVSTEVFDLIQAKREVFAKVCSDPSIEFEREASFAVQILSNNEFLMNTALRNKPSLQAAITNVAAIGISLNPASKQAYLVPRKGAVCLDISYMGMMHLAQQTGAISWGQAVIVRKNDTFELSGIDKPPTHTFNPFDTERGEIIGVYVVVKTDTGDYLTHAMPISKVYDIRDRSEAYKAYLKNGTSCPWVTDEEEMIKKTCVKQAAKYWPRRTRLDEAIQHMNVEGEEGIVFEEKEITENGEVKKPNNMRVTSEVLASLPVETQMKLKGIAKKVQARLYIEGIDAAVAEWEGAGLNADEKVAGWDFFESDERSAIKHRQIEIRKTKTVDA